MCVQLNRCECNIEWEGQALKLISLVRQIGQNCYRIGHKNENNMRDSKKLAGSNVYFKSSTLIDGLAI